MVAPASERNCLTKSTNAGLHASGLMSRDEVFILLFFSIVRRMFVVKKKKYIFIYLFLFTYLFEKTKSDK